MPASHCKVHKHHIEMMVQSKLRIEQAGFTIIGGLMAITNMDYVRRKKDADPISDEHRMAALSLACSEVPGGWLKPDRRGADFPSAGRLIQKLQAELPGVSVFNIVGADTVVRLCKNGSKFMQPMVVVGRAGCNNRLVKETVENSEAAGAAVFYVEELPAQVSSHRIRQALFDGDQELLRSQCPEAAVEYLWERREDLYGGHPELLARRLAIERRPKEKENHEEEEEVKVAEKPRARRKEELPTWSQLSKTALVVGITGAPSAGKSTLAVELLEALKEKESVTLICQNDFDLGSYSRKWAWWWDWDSNQWLSYWESPDATDWIAMEAALVEAAKDSSIILVEGHCLFSSKRLFQVLNGLVWLDVDEESCWNRRSQYPRGWQPARYFHECLWPGHEQHQTEALGSQKSAPGCGGKSQHLGPTRCLGLNGLDDPHRLTQRALKAVLRWQGMEDTRVA
ncbi:unnamed protein product [Effrenium voratum]|nr:unnamed protein product [Effrenium voratum]